MFCYRSIKLAFFLTFFVVVNVNFLFNDQALDMAQPKQISGLALHLIFHRSQLFNMLFKSRFAACKRGLPENLHVVLCPNKQRSFEPFMCLNFVLFNSLCVWILF